MKVTIFGATGSLGQHILRQALQQNFEVKVLTRSAARLKDFQHPKLRIVEGDLLNRDDVRKAMEGSEYVMCAIGDGAKGKIRAVGTKNILEGMASLGLRRLVCQTTLGIGESRNNLNFFWKHVMFGMLLKKAYVDHQLQEEYVKKSQVDWTIVRPSAFANGPITRSFKAGFGPHEKNLSLKISRADIADFMIQQMKSDQYIRQAVSISN